MAETAKIIRVKISQRNDGDYEAHMFAANGEEIFRSSEGYRNFTDVLSACKTSWPDAVYEGPNGAIE